MWRNRHRRTSGSTPSGVLARGALDHVSGCAVDLAAIERVPTGAAVQDVGAEPAHEHVVAFPAEESVVTGAAVQDVGAEPAAEGVRQAVAGQSVGGVPPVTFSMFLTSLSENHLAGAGGERPAPGASIDQLVETVTIQNPRGRDGRAAPIVVHFAAELEAVGSVKRRKLENGIQTWQVCSLGSGLRYRAYRERSRGCASPLLRVTCSRPTGA